MRSEPPVAKTLGRRSRSERRGRKPAKSFSPETRGVLLVAAAALLWSTGGVGIKALEDPPLKVAFFRSAFAAVALIAILRPRPGRLSATFWTAVVSYAACLTTFVVATKTTTAANAIFLQYSGVVWVLLLSPVVLREPLRARDVLAVSLSLCGMALFFVGKFGSGKAGDLVALASGVFFAVLVLSLRRERDKGAEAAVTYGNVLAAALLFPFVRDNLALSGRSTAILLFLGLFQLAGAYTLFVHGLRHVTATQATLVSMLEPVTNPVWVFLFLGERPSPFAALGGAIVLGAIAWRSLAAAPVTLLAPPD
ncbi:MAG TPA: DMT family transporter [Thermoanaerobaculia bacterium]|nr:DMT family transporter [Thermoanaerobaculia bacterium]